LLRTGWIVGNTDISTRLLETSVKPVIRPEFYPAGILQCAA